jgi:Ca2+-binding RTX toxin-like protein
MPVRRLASDSEGQGMFVQGTQASDTINAADGVTNGDDLIMGYGGHDTIFGLGGNDDIEGGQGGDTIDGGDGIDTARYINSAAGVVVSLASGIGIGGDAQGDTLSNIENLFGSAHDDILVGNNAANVIVGGAGNNTLKGGGGHDELIGNLGNDTLEGGSGGDLLFGGAGIDTAVYAASSAGVTVSLLLGHGSGGDAAGDDLEYVENVTGSNHGDSLYGDNGNNVLKGMAGADLLKGFGGADTLLGGDHNDYLFGMDHADTLAGGHGNDVLNGGDHADTLSGDHGNDELTGGYGPDNMTGGAGGDTFIFQSLNDTGWTGQDFITDFKQYEGDTIDLSQIDANTLLDGDQAFVFIGNDVDYTGTAGELRFNFGSLECDANGDANTDFYLTVDTNGLALNNGAFLL